jgi:hypothetical protein
MSILPRVPNTGMILLDNIDAIYASLTEPLQTATPEITLIGFVDFGNGYLLFYGVVAIEDNFVPFTVRDPDLGEPVLWHEIADIDPGVAAINAATLIGRFASGEVRDPH